MEHSSKEGRGKRSRKRQMTRATFSPGIHEGVGKLSVCMTQREKERTRGHHGT